MAALHCQADDACVFVDAMPLEDAKASISQAAPGVTCHYLQEQSQFLARHPFIAQGTRGFRWIHVDGEHTGQSVINDLEIADHLLSDRGIAVFDDFFSPGYPQVTQMIGNFQIVDYRLPGMFTVHVNPAKTPRALRDKRMARQKLRLFQEIMASCLWQDLADGRLGGVERHSVNKDALFTRLAMQSRQSSRLPLPHPNLDHVSRDSLSLLITQKTVPDSDGGCLKPALNL